MWFDILIIKIAAVKLSRQNNFTRLWRKKNRISLLPLVTQVTEMGLEVRGDYRPPSSDSGEFNKFKSGPFHSGKFVNIWIWRVSLTCYHISGDSASVTHEHSGARHVKHEPYVEGPCDAGAPGDTQLHFDHVEDREPNK